jgi:hypothetical protein
MYGGGRLLQAVPGRPGRFRTIRSRRHRAQRGQVSAVATILGLLLIVSFIAEFEIAPLPARLAELEFEHDLLVQNQLLRLQAVVLAEARAPSTHLQLTSPITLGSEAAPPWGGPSSGQILLESFPVRGTGSFTLAKVVPAPPIWNTGSSCLTGGAGHCAGNGNVDYWNVTNANNTSFAIKVTGNHNSAQYNMSANNDPITIDWTGGDTGFVNFIINGSDDKVVYNKGGSDVTNPTANFIFFGQRDVFSFNPSGSHSGSGSMALHVVFVGTVRFVCPFGNLSASDKLGTLSAGGSNLNMTVEWWNADGYSSPPHRITYPGGGGNNEFLTFQNSTGVKACAFTRAYSTNYVQQYGKGILVHLLNTYRPSDNLAYDEGAVVAGTSGSSSVMVSPPEFESSTAAQGTVAQLTLVNLVGDFSSAAGFGTSGVSTTILGVSSLVIMNGQSPTQLTGPLFLNLTTAFPAAWASFFTSAHQAFPGGVRCVSSVAFSPPFSCLQPPTGAMVTISVALSVQGLTVTTITASVKLL